MPATIHLELWYTYLRQRGREENSETDAEEERRLRKQGGTGERRDKAVTRMEKK